MMHIAIPQRIRLSRARGFNLQAHSRALNGLEAVKVDRSTKWGNPFIVGKHGTRKECVTAIRELSSGRFSRNRNADIEDQQMWLWNMNRNVEGLRGKNLACWCPLPKDGEPDLCHAAVLLEIANQ